MAAEVHQFTCVIPANTPKTAPVTFAIGLPNYDVESIDLDVPPGPAGLMGFQIAVSGQQWLPWEAGQFIVWDDRHVSWSLVDQPNLGAWEVIGYNTDAVYSHEVVVRLHVNPIADASSSAAPTVNIVMAPSTAPATLVTL